MVFFRGLFSVLPVSHALVCVCEWVDVHACLCVWFYTVLSHVLICVTLTTIKRQNSWKFPGGPVVRTQSFHFQGTGSIPDRDRCCKSWIQPEKKKKKKIHNCSTSTKIPFPITNPWQLLFCFPSLNFVILKVLYKWNHIVCNP